MSVAAGTLSLLVLLLILLPVIPAWQEWRNPTDDKPLNVVRTYDGNVTHFADSFRKFLLEQIGSVVDDVEVGRKRVAEGKLKRGETYVVVGTTVHDFPLLASEIAKREAGRVVVAAGDMLIPSGYVMNQEVYGRKDLTVGAQTACRAVLADGAIHFDRGAVVLRWAHANGQINAASEARLWGRVTSDSDIVLAAGSGFSRLHAPVITTEGKPGGKARVPDQVEGPRMPLKPPRGLILEDSERWVIKGHLEVPQRSSHQGHLVATKDFAVGSGSLIQGSIKSRRRLRLDNHVEIAGAVVARQALHIGEHAIIKGPIVGEELVEIGAGSIIGSAEHPTTITADQIRLGAGVTVYGTVWARETGLVTESLADPRAETKA